MVDPDRFELPKPYRYRDHVAASLPASPKGSINLVCLEGIEPLANLPSYFGYCFTDSKRGQDTNL